MPLTVCIEVLSIFSSQQRISLVLLAVKAGSTFVTSVELSVNTVLSMGDDEGLRESFRKTGICYNQTGFQREHSECCPCFGNMKSDERSFIKHVPAGRENPANL